jgi:hypothetical protein
MSKKLSSKEWTQHSNFGERIVLAFFKRGEIIPVKMRGVDVELNGSTFSLFKGEDLDKDYAIQLLHLIFSNLNQEEHSCFTIFFKGDKTPEQLEKEVATKFLHAFNRVKDAQDFFYSDEEFLEAIHFESFKLD